jgi:hypothetical protein
VLPTHKALTAHFPCLLHALQIKGGDVKLVKIICIFYADIRILQKSRYAFKIQTTLPTSERIS